ncbi:MAG: hypothetical protein MSS69_06410 [Spirochaetales bacterium]|nr:hypothetical protein [Spirochaetales bacterium]
MKKILCILLVFVFIVSGAIAGNIYYAFGDIGQHPDILMGFFPSYAYMGVGVKLPEIIENNTTDVQVLIGEGYLQRLLWQDKDSGENNYDGGAWDKDSALRYNVWTNDLTFRFRQGFGVSPVSGKDLLLLTTGVNLKYERYYSGSEFGPFDIKGTMDGIINSDYDGKIYPELAGGGKAFLGTEIQANLKLDLVKDTLHTNDGFWARIDMKYGPKAINTFADGFADYISFNVNGVGAKTLYNLTNQNGESLVSFILIDRMNASWTGGESVPSFIQGPVSLGRKVRGFNTYTYNTEFTAVNNLDLRITGPGLGLEKLAPRINLFVDCGYGWGRVLNTDRVEKNFLASVGVQVEMSFFDFIDLGYEINYLLVDKEKYTQPGKITTNFTFFLDF